MNFNNQKEIFFIIFSQNWEDIISLEEKNKK